MSFLDDLINKLTTQMSNFEIKNKKSSIFVIFLIIIKKLYGCSPIFKLIIGLFATIVFLNISNDIDNNNNIMENKSTKNYATLFFVTYLIGNTSIIDKNPNIKNLISSLLSSIINTLTLTS